VRLWERLLGPDPRRVGADPDPRLSLANERTFLAWNRTALALIGAGLAVTQLLPPFDVPGGRHAIGLPLIALGVVVGAASQRRWAVTEQAIRLGASPPPSRLGLLVAVTVAVVGVLALIIASVGSNP
jgi:putative membrane protein